MTEDGKPHLYTDLWQPGIGFCGSPENKRMCQAERAKICRKRAWSTWRLSKGLRWGLWDDQNGTQPHRMAVPPVYGTELRGRDWASGTTLRFTSTACSDVGGPEPTKDETVAVNHDALD